MLSYICCIGAKSLTSAVDVEVFKSSVVWFLRSVFDLAPFNAADLRPVVCLNMFDSILCVLALGTAVLLHDAFVAWLFALLLCEELEEAAVAVLASCVEDADDRTLCLSGPLLLEFVASAAAAV